MHVYKSLPKNTPVHIILNVIQPIRKSTNTVCRLPCYSGTGGQVKCLNVLFHITTNFFTIKYISYP